MFVRAASIVAPCDTTGKTMHSDTYPDCSPGKTRIWMALSILRPARKGRPKLRWDQAYNVGGRRKAFHAATFSPAVLYSRVGIGLEEGRRATRTPRPLSVPGLQSVPD